VKEKSVDERLMFFAKRELNPHYKRMFADAGSEIESLRSRLAEADALLLDIAEMRVPVLPSRFMDESMAEAARAYLARTP
jgi:hypothetical protein